MPPNNEEMTAREISGVHSDIKDLKRGQDAMAKQVGDVLVQLARQDERQAETSRTLDRIVTDLTSSFVTLVQHGDITKRVASLESWLTWILRISIGALIAGSVLAIKLQHGF
jgi:hypothetical protein